MMPINKPDSSVAHETYDKTLLWKWDQNCPWHVLMKDIYLPQSWVEFGGIINEIWFCSLSEKNNDLPQVEIVV